MFTKVAGGIIGLGLISTGSIAMAKPHWLGMDYMPSFHFLSEDNDYKTKENSDYGNKFGKTYKNYLVGVTHKNGKTNETNQSWWEWSFRRLEKTRHGKFKGVTKEYGNNSTTDLNKVCEEAYKKGANELKSNGETTIQDTEFKKSDVWKYCSPGLLTHTNEDKDKYDSKKIGGDDSNKTTLVSVKDSSNNWFWEQRNKDFWSTDSDWSGSKATGTNEQSIFKKEYEDKKAENKQRERQTIKDLCKEAYSKDKATSGTTDNNNDDAKKFCVLETSNG